MGEFPEKIWAIEKGHPSRYRVSCSVLEHGPDEATEYVRADLYAALEAQLAERVRVKPLEWKPLSNTGSESGFGGGRSEYTLIPTQNGWRVYGIPGESDGGTEFFTMETAKAAAQADFERRILSALEATPARGRRSVG